MDETQRNRMWSSSYLLPDPGGQVVRELILEIDTLKKQQRILADAINQCDGDGGCRAYRVMKEMMG